MQDVEVDDARTLDPYTVDVRRKGGNRRRDKDSRFERNGVIGEKSEKSTECVLLYLADEPVVRSVRVVSSESDCSRT